ncbi:hypothetical protein [Lacinutrix mariniflava]|uniref:hypothetical protein n=1 Tax=Lacinutrix mariniflava TaxID=342955 RepID=UPI0006E3D6BE|nr:hypothetical protein [Lacinutrix mariniflava]
MVELSQEDIKKIDEFLMRHKVKFIDVRLELIDHLASKYELENQNEKLHAFLMRNRDFIKTFIKERQSKIHWAYQKQIIKQVALFFYKPRFLIFTALIILVLFNIKELNAQKITLWLFLGSITTPLAIALYKQIRAQSKLKKIQSYQTVCSIMSLPSLFLYMFTPIKNHLPFDGNLFYIYWFIALIMGISGLIVFNKLLKETYENYNKIVFA